VVCGEEKLDKWAFQCGFENATYAQAVIHRKAHEKNCEKWAFIAALKWNYQNDQIVVRIRYILLNRAAVQKKSTGC